MTRTPVMARWWLAAGSRLPNGQFHLLENLLLQKRLQVPDGACCAAAGCVLVSAPSELPGHHVHIDGAFRSHADPPVAGCDLLEEHDCFDVLDGEREIDQPVGVVERGAAARKEALVDTQGCDATARV